MVRIIFFIALGFVILFFIKSLLRSRPKPSSSSGTQPKQAHAQSMVQCHTCGVYLSEKEAVYRAGDAFCSEAHANKNK